MTRVAIFATLAASLAVSLSAGASARSDVAGATAGSSPASTLAAAGPDETVDALVVLKAQANLNTIKASTRSARLKAVIQTLQTLANSTQKNLRALLATRKAEGKVAMFVPLWVENAIEVEAVPSVIEELSGRPEVAEIRPEREIRAPAGAATAASAEANVDLVNADDLWNIGFRGQGVVVANMDTGVDVSHPALSGRWRGGTNSWYDPNGEHPTTPTDVSGHGTWTMGVMVGGDEGGTSIGMAPGAKWIAVKIFNDRGVATTGGIHLGFQWLLDPDGNPSTPDAPNVVNDSWTMSTFSCNVEFQLDLRSLRAAGIVPVFAAGNFGPGTSTIPSPANNPEALSVGAVNNSDVIDSSSGRGPSACDQSVAPDLVAPGVGIHTTDIFGLYTNATGTSLAAPHVAGALALLLGAFPNMTADRQEAALESGAVDLGGSGPDNAYGDGRLDVLAAYNWLLSSPDFAVSASPASTTAAAGSPVSYDVTVAGIGGFTGDVALTLEGPITSHASWTFSPAVVSGGSGNSHLEVTTASDIVPGTYQLLIRGTSGSTTHAATVTLVVPAPPDFTVAATPLSVSVVAGSTASYQVSVGSVNGFAGNVALGLSGLPTGNGSWSFSPSSISTAGTSTLAISTSSAAIPGTYSLTVSGTSGSIAHSALVSLVIMAAPDFSIAITPSSRTVRRGSSTTYSVSISAQNGFTGSVSLSTAGLPSGATATFSKNPVVASGTSTLTVKTSGKTTRGTLVFTVTGRSGTITHSVSATLTVN